MILRMALILFGLFLLAGCASHRSLNQAGERVEIRDHLVAGKTNIFYFYADW